MKQGLWALTLLAGLELGCMSGRVVSGGALVHSQYPYSVTYDDEKKKSVLGDDWLLENYRRADTLNGAGASAGDVVEIERKEGYDEVYELDFDDDDKEDAKATLPYPDLILVNKKTNARIEVTTLLLDKRLADKELRILLQNVVDSKAGTRSLFIGLGRATAGVERRMASRLLESGPATLEKQPGLVATVERADLDQLELDPKARWSRSRIFLLHAPFDYYAVETVETQPSTPRYHKYRVLMMVEYTNSAEDFEAQYPDLLRLLNKIHLLDDDMLLDYLAEPLSHCDHSGKATLKLSISGVGVADITDAGGLSQVSQACAREVLGHFRFNATSVARSLERSYDFSKPIKPAWLTQGSYVEDRPTAEKAEPAAVRPPEGDAPAPATTTDVAPPTDATGGAETTPDDTQAPPTQATPAP